MSSTLNRGNVFKVTMLNCIRTANSVFTVNSSSGVLSAGCSALLREKLDCGRITLRKISHESKLSDVLRKNDLPDFKRIIPLIPKRFWKKRSDFVVTYGFTVHKKTAGEIAATVMDSVSRKTKEPIIIELNPGIGLITEQLFSRGLQKLVVFDDCCLKPFKEIIKKYETQIELHQMNAFNTDFGTLEFPLPKCFFFFKKLLGMEGNEVIIIGISPNRLVFRRLVEFILNCSFSSFKNIEWFVTIPHSIYNCVLNKSNRNARASDYGCVNVLFDAEVLKKYPRDNFLPLSFEDNPEVTLVKLKRKVDVPSKEELLLYRNFLRVIGSRKTNSVIGQIERWFPGSGPHFIAKGVSVTNQTYEFSPEELFKLFKILRELKGYDDSFTVMKTYDLHDVPNLGNESWSSLS